MRFYLLFTIVLLGVGMVLTTIWLSFGRSQQTSDNDDWLVYGVDHSFYRMNEQSRAVYKIMDYGTEFLNETVVSPDQTYLIIEQREGYDRAASNLYRVNPSGTRIRLTNLPGREIFQTFSPDGKWIYFTSRPPNRPSALYRIRANGQHLQTVQDYTGIREYHIFGWSSDGQWMYIALDAHPDQYAAAGLARMYPDGSYFENLTGTSSDFSWWFDGFGPDHQHVLMSQTDRSGRKYLYRATADLQALTLIADWDNYLKVGDFLITSSGWVYYSIFNTQPRPNQWQIHRLNWMTGESHPLNFPVSIPPTSYSMELVALGDWIYYHAVSAACHEDAPDTNCYSDLWRVRWDGAYLQRVAAMSGEEVNLIPLDDWLYFQAGDVDHGYGRLYRVNAETLQTQLVMDATGAAYFHMIAWMQFPEKEWHPIRMVMIGAGLWAVGLIIALRRAE